MPVTVLGAGVSGLTTALSLLGAGARVRVVAAEPVHASTSHLAAAVWFPTHAGPPQRVGPWSRHTYEVLAEQAGRGVPRVTMRESPAPFREPPGEPDWARSVGRLRAAGADELPPGYRHGLRFVVPLVEMPRHLPWLVERVRDRGGELGTRRVRSLAELAGPDVDAVVNCSGLAARSSTSSGCAPAGSRSASRRRPPPRPGPGSCTTTGTADPGSPSRGGARPR